MLRLLLCFNIMFLMNSDDFSFNENYSFYKTRNHMNQIYGGYYLRFEGQIIENQNRGNGRVFREQVLPVEFVDIVRTLGIREFILESAYGNSFLVKDIEEIPNDVPS